MNFSNYKYCIECIGINQKPKNFMSYKVITITTITTYKLLSYRDSTVYKIQEHIINLFFVVSSLR